MTTGTAISDYVIPEDTKYTSSRHTISDTGGLIKKNDGGHVGFAAPHDAQKLTHVWLFVGPRWWARYKMPLDQHVGHAYKYNIAT